MVRLTDRPDMILDVYSGCKTTTQQQQQSMGYPVFIYSVGFQLAVIKSEFKAVDVQLL